MESKDDDNIDAIKNLIACRDNIRETLFKYRDKLNAIKRMKTFDVDTILAVAQNLSYSRHAPPGWVPGAPLIKNHPPAPQPEEMRGGMLEKYNLQQKAKQNGFTDVSNEDNEKSLMAKQMFTSIFATKESMERKQDLKEHSMEVDEVPSNVVPTSLDDIHVAVGRKTNTISFTSYDSSDED